MVAHPSRADLFSSLSGDADPDCQGPTDPKHGLIVHASERFPDLVTAGSHRLVDCTDHDIDDIVWNLNSPRAKLSATRRRSRHSPQISVSHLKCESSGQEETKVT